MSVIRQDVTTKAWVIIASERAKRPHDFRRAMPAAASPDHEGSCPFCPGHEMSTPPEVWRLSDPQGSGWAVRVILLRRGHGRAAHVGDPARPQPRP
jgi:UDPglucose--hexose-1-phosphate uridylyltransferase